MSQECRNADAYFDGELPRDQAERFRDHMIGCAKCIRALENRAFLEAVAESHGDYLRARARTSRRSPTRALRLAGVGALAAGLAAAVVGLVVRSHGEGAARQSMEVAILDTARARGGELPPLGTATARAVEVRFTYPGADAYRPYAVQRGAERPRDPVPLTALARLEEAKEFRAVAAGMALSGDLARANEYLDQAGPSRLTSADRAGVAILAGHPDQAIRELEPILTRETIPPQAVWNRALALEAMHLPLAAAEVWEKVALLGEPGWGEEARQREAELRAARDTHRAAWERLLAVCDNLVLRGELPPADVVAVSPSNIRSCLYNAMRVAPSVDRLASFRPLARQLDLRANDGALERELDAQLARGVSSKAPFLERYRTLHTTGTIDDDQAKVTRFIDELRAAGQDDLLFGAIDRASRWRSEVGTLAAIASKRRDPWLQLVATRGRAAAAEAKGDYTQAERIEREAVSECDRRHFESLCARIEYQRVLTLLNASRLTEADRAATGALQRAEASADNVNYLLRAALAAISATRADYALARAYGEDATRREPTFCSGRADAAEASAEGYLLALEPDNAKRALEGGPQCADIMPLQRATELVLLARMGRTLAETETLPAALKVIRTVGTRGQQLRADAVEGNLLLLSNEAAGEKLLRATLAASTQTPETADGREAAEWSRTSLAWLEAARGDGAAAAALMTGELTSARCSVTIGVDHERFFSTATDAHGETMAQVEAHATDYPPARDRLVSSAMVGRLHECDSVDVYATYPIHGTAALLPPDVAWSYRVRRAVTHDSIGGPPKRLIVSDIDLPAELGLPRLAPWQTSVSEDKATTWLRGGDATVGRLLTEITSATEVQIHAHGLLDIARADAPLLVLTPDASGRWDLSAQDLERIRLRGHPVVVLAACDVARMTTVPQAHFSLPPALLRAGARAVFAAAEPIPDAKAGSFFEGLLGRIRSGSSPKVALRDERLSWRGSGWVTSLLLFE